MNGNTMAELQTLLQAVRGETRVKTSEEPIRKIFIQSAADEIFNEYDWEFNRRIADITIDSEGYYEVPKDFSVMNDFSATSSTIKYERDSFTVSSNKGKILLSGPTAGTLTLTYYIKAPTLDNDEKVYFPQPMLIVERAYVRLKTAYFPDESSEKEYLKSKQDVRLLYTHTRPRGTFHIKGRG